VSRPNIALTLLQDLDPAAISGLEDGAQVPLLPDTSPGARHADQSDPVRQPLYVASAPEFGGKPALRFDGVDDLLVPPSQTGVSVRTHVFVFAPDPSTAATRYFWSGSSTARFSYRNSAAGTTLQTYANSSTLTVGPFSTDPQVAVTAWSSTQTGQGWLNGVKGTDTTQGSGSHGWVGTRLGADWSGSSPGGMLFARALTFAGTATDADVATIDSWVQETYGIAVADYVPQGGGEEPPAADARVSRDGAAYADAEAFVSISGGLYVPLSAVL